MILLYSIIHPAIIYKKIVHQHNLLGFGLEDTLIKRL